MLPAFMEPSQLEAESFEASSSNERVIFEFEFEFELLAFELIDLIDFVIDFGNQLVGLKGVPHGFK